MPEETRICKKCGKEKSIHEFSSFIEKRTGREYYKHTCKICIDKRNIKTRRNTLLCRVYGITEEQYEKLLKAQNNVCAICGRPEIMIKYDKIQSLSVDHRHKPFKVRGLLCDRCNRLLGRIEHTPGGIRAFINYLEKNI